MGSRGPVRKRDAERRRVNKPEVPTTEVEVDEGPTPRPAAEENWHPIARDWFESLERSAQSRFYEPSDWQTARIVAESISRDLKTQPIGVHPETGEAVMAKVPLKGGNLQAYLKAFTALMVTEGDRRRAHMEIKRQDAQNHLAPVASISDRRRSVLG